MTAYWSPDKKRRETQRKDRDQSDAAEAREGLGCQKLEEARKDPRVFGGSVTRPTA